MPLKIILGDGTEIGITDFTSSSFIADGKTFLEAMNDYQTLARNTGAVQVKNGDDETVLNAEGLTFDGIQVMHNQAGSYTAFYYYHGAKAETVEDEYSVVGRILMGVEA